MFKNTASQKLIVFAFDSTTNTPKTGDAANLTAYVSKDYGAVTVLGDTSATEMDSTNAKGYYLFDLTQAETNADCLMFSAKSSTSNIVVIGAPAVVQTVPAAIGTAGVFPAAAAGASGGLLISGSNSGTTTLGALTVTGATTMTGNVSMAAGLTITQSSSNTPGISVTGNGSGAGILSTGGATGHGVSIVGGATSGDGISCVATTSGHGLTVTGVGTTKHGVNATGGSTTSHGISATGGGVGHGILATSGSGATGDGIRCVGASTNGNGLNLAGVGTGAGLLTTGGATGIGLSAVGGSTSGVGVKVATTSGDGLSITPTAGNAITATGNGTSKHGLAVTGGTAGTSDGFVAVAGTGGVPIRGNITGNITGTLSVVTTATNLTNAPTSGDFTATMKTSIGTAVAASAVASVTGNVTGSVGSVASGGISSTSFASGAITATAIAADAIGASELASDAVAEIADAVWDEILSGHAVSGSTGEALSAAGGAGDPWITTLPGSYTAGQAGYILGTNLDALVSSRGTSTLTQAQVTGGSYALNSSSFAFNTAMDFTTTQKTSLNNATPAVTVSDKTGFKLASDGLDLVTAWTVAITGNVTGNLSGSVGSVSGAVGSVAGNVGGIASGGITSTSFATGAITATAIAADAIGASELATDAVTEIATAVFTTQMTESYRATNAAPTLAQALCETLGHLGESSISGTTKTVKKFDGSTTAKVFTLNDATTPTAITETT